VATQEETQCSDVTCTTCDLGRNLTYVKWRYYCYISKPLSTRENCVQWEYIKCFKVDDTVQDAYPLLQRKLDNVGYKSTLWGWVMRNLQTKNWCSTKCVNVLKCSIM
jgi:hypothetical protein